MRCKFCNSAVCLVFLLAAAVMAGEPVYDRMAGHPWDRVREIFYTHRFPTGEVYEHPHVFAPPWNEYVPFVHDAVFYEQVLARLNAVKKLPAAQMEEQSVVRRLIFLRDLWPVFDGLHGALVNIPLDGDATEKAVKRRDELLRRVAGIMNRLELTEVATKVVNLKEASSEWKSYLRLRTAQSGSKSGPINEQFGSGLTPGDYRGTQQVMRIAPNGGITFSDNQGLCGMTLYDDDRLKIAFRNDDQIWTDMTLPLVTSPGPQRRASWFAKIEGSLYRVTAIPISTKGCLFRLEKRRDGKLIDGSQAFFAIPSRRTNDEPGAVQDTPKPKDLKEWRVDQRTTGVVAGRYTGARQVMQIAADGAVTYNDDPLSICHIEVLPDDRLRATFQDSSGMSQEITLPLVTPASQRWASWSAEFDGGTLRVTAIPYSSNVYIFRQETLRNGKLIEGAQEFYGIEQKLRRITPEAQGKATGNRQEPATRK